MRAELAQARSLSEELIAGLGTPGSGTYSVMAWTNIMGSLVQQGDWMAAEPAYQRAHAAYDEAQHAEHASLMGGNFGVLAAAWSAHALWFRGLADQARSAWPRSAGDGEPGGTPILPGACAVLSRDTACAAR
ncbi:hypothetical protein ACTMU2_05025 [Cupriavidus basilensis]